MSLTRLRDSRRIVFSIAIAIMLVPLSVLSKEIEGLQVWKLRGKGTQLLLPVIKGEAPAVTARNYLEAFNHGPSNDETSNYSEMLKDFTDSKTQVDSQQKPIKGKFWLESEEFGSDHFSVLPHFDAGGIRVPMAVVANRPGHMSTHDPFFKNVHQGFTEKGGADVYIVPLGLETYLTESELTKYHELVSSNFPALLSLGGADLDPTLYGETNKGLSTGVNAQRDQTEIKLIRTYTKTENHAFYGICRGHQAFAVAMGGALIQHLIDELDTSKDPEGIGKHRRGKYATDEGIQSAWHDVELLETSPLYQLLGKKVLKVNSRHHQAVKRIPHGTRAIASEPVPKDSTDFGHTIVDVEALDRTNQEGQTVALTVQFHPEDMHVDGTSEDAEHARKIMRWMVDNARQFLPKQKQGGCLY